MQISGAGSQSQISGSNSRQMDLFSAGFVAGLQSVNKARISSGMTILRCLIFCQLQKKLLLCAVFY